MRQLVMRKMPFEVFTLNESDNEFTAFAKGGANAWIVGTLYLGVLVGATAIIGKAIQKKDVSNED